jgi:hypothetical protein
MTALTKAQERALEWLPKDGGWSGEVPFCINGGLHELFAIKAVRVRTVDGVYQGRLSRTGVALRASRQPHQTPPEPAEPLGGTGQPSDASGASCGPLRAGMEGGR